MSMNSGLIRDKNGALTRAGKVVVLEYHTGDDTPVVQDERLDVDLNRLISNEMARQENFKIPGSQDYGDLTQHPTSRGAAEQRALELRQQLSDRMLPGENYELAIHRLMAEKAALELKINQNNQNPPSALKLSENLTTTPETANPPASKQNS